MMAVRELFGLSGRRKSDGSRRSSLDDEPPENAPRASGPSRTSSLPQAEISKDLWVPRAPASAPEPMQTPTERGDNMDLAAMRRVGPAALRIDMANSRVGKSGMSQIGELRAAMACLQAAIRCLEEGDDAGCERMLRQSDVHRARSGRRNSLAQG